MTSGTKVYDSMEASGLYTSRVWVGSNDPIAKKAENAYTSTHKYRRNSSLRGRVSLPSGVPQITPAYPSYEVMEIRPVWDNNSELALLAKVTSALRQHDFSGGIFLAELPKALHSVTASALTLFNGFRHAKRGNFAGAIRALARGVNGGNVHGQKYKTMKGTLWVDKSHTAVTHEEIATTWLAMQYVWKPLLSDIHESMQYIASKTDLPREVAVKVSKGQSPKPVNRAQTGADYSFVLWETVIGQLRVRVVESISTARSLGLLNPATVPWELLPFSFVVDWFIPIGSYLDSIGFLQGLSLDYGRTMYYKSEGTKRFQACDTMPSTSGPTFLYPHTQYCNPFWVAKYKAGTASSYHKCYGGDVYRKLGWVERTHGTSLNVPTPRPKDLEKVFSIPHILNASALIWSGITESHKAPGPRKATRLAPVQPPWTFRNSP